MTQQQHHAEVMAQLQRREVLQQLFEAGELDDEYAEYIINHSHGDRIICNGDTLIAAMEDGYLAESFIDHLEKQ